MVVGVLDAALQRVVRPKPSRVCWISDPDATGNAYHLFRHVFATRGSVEHVWLVRSPETARRLRVDIESWRRSVASDASVRVIRRRSVRGYWAWLRSRFTFHTHGAYPMTRTAHRRHVVSLWHGMPIKAIGALNATSPNPRPTFGTFHLATSRAYRSVIARAFRVDEEQVLVAGLPRCDVLRRPHPLGPDDELIRRTLGITTKRFVVWTPTYRAMGTEVVDPARPPSFLDDLPDGTLDEIASGAASADCTVVVKLHPFDPLNHVDVDVGPSGVQWLRSDDLLRAGVELYDVLTRSDGLLTDVSSVLLDYLVTDRPLGVVGFDPESYHRDVIVPLEPILASPRIDRLDGPVAIRSYFDRVMDRSVELDDALLRWAHDAPIGRGCEDVLTAVGL